MKTSKRLTAITIAGAIGLAAFPALAQQPAERGNQPPGFAGGDPAANGGAMQVMLARLLALDLNDDGQITEREFAEGWMLVFQQLDANGDGVIDPAELPILGAQLAQGGVAEMQNRGGANARGFNAPGGQQGNQGRGGPDGPNFADPRMGSPNLGGGMNFGQHQRFNGDNGRAGPGERNFTGPGAGPGMGSPNFGGGMNFGPHQRFNGNHGQAGPGGRNFTGPGAGPRMGSPNFGGGMNFGPQQWFSGHRGHPGGFGNFGPGQFQRR